MTSDNTHETAQPSNDSYGGSSVGSDQDAGTRDENAGTMAVMFPQKPPQFDTEMVDAAPAPEHYWRTKLKEAAHRVEQELQIRQRRAGGARSLTRRAATLKAGRSPRFGYQKWLGELTVEWMLSSGQLEVHPDYPDRVRLGADDVIRAYAAGVRH